MVGIIASSLLSIMSATLSTNQTSDVTMNSVFCKKYSSKDTTS